MYLREPEMTGRDTSSPGASGTRPVFASIGTVLIDCFDIPPRPSLDTQTPGITSPPSPTRSASSRISSTSNSLSTSTSTSSSTSFSTASSISSLAQHLLSRTGALTPQREFGTDDTGPPVSSPASSSSGARRRTSKQKNVSATTAETVSTSEQDAAPLCLELDLNGGSSDGGLASGSRNGSGSGSGSGSAHDSIGSLSGPIEVLGGGALYALVGARMWLPPAQCRTLVDTDEGRADLSEELERELEGYGEGCWGYLEGEGRRMIRSRIRYEGTVRLYKHVIRPHHRPFASLLHTPIDGSAYLHISPPYAPEDVVELLKQQKAAAATAGDGGRTWTPKIVYEPSPHGCHTGQQEYLEEILPDLEVLSPNHEELLSLYGHPLHSLSSPLLRPALEEIISHLLDLGIGPEGAGIVAVRCGRLGSVVGTRKDGVRWVPAYWEKGGEHMVKDVTGGGNAYLGGYIAGLQASHGDAYEAALYGTVSASFTVEQIGLPKLCAAPKSESHATVGDGPESTRGAEGLELRPAGLDGELWNGEVPEWRLEMLRRRLTDREAMKAREEAEEESGDQGDGPA